MSLNARRSGHRYPPYFYDVGTEKVREFAQATFVGAAPYDPGTTHDGEETPPAFAAAVIGRVIPMVVDDPELGGHWNLLHTGQVFDFHRPLRIGDRLRCQPVIADITSRRSMDVVTVAVEVADAADDAPVFTATSTLVFFEEGR